MTIDPPCAMCGMLPLDCICRPCWKCGERGQPSCYEPGGHGMAETPEQLVGRIERWTTELDDMRQEKEYARDLERAKCYPSNGRFPRWQRVFRWMMK